MDGNQASSGVLDPTAAPGRQAHRPSRRPEIVAAAMRELGESLWLENITSGQIMTRTDMGLSSFYYHFGSIDELLEVVIDHLVEGIVTRTAVQHDGGAAGGWAIAVVRRHADWIHDRPHEARLLVSLSSASLGGPGVLAAFHDRITRAVESINGELSRIAPAMHSLEAAIVARALLSLVIELADRTLDRDADPETLAVAAEVIAQRLVQSYAD